jgi:hypothetical protein
MSSLPPSLRWFDARPGVNPLPTNAEGGVMADFVMTLDEFIAELETIRGQLDGTVPVLNAEDDLPVRPVAITSGVADQPTVHIEVIHA